MKSCYTEFHGGCTERHRESTCFLVNQRLLSGTQCLLCGTLCPIFLARHFSAAPLETRPKTPSNKISPREARRTWRNPPESPFEKGGFRGISYSCVSVSPCLDFSAGLLGQFHFIKINFLVSIKSCAEPCPEPAEGLVEACIL